jgi:hypothetical protein
MRPAKSLFDPASQRMLQADFAAEVKRELPREAA